MVAISRAKLEGHNSMKTFLHVVVQHFGVNSAQSN